MIPRDSSYFLSSCLMISLSPPFSVCLCVYVTRVKNPVANDPCGGVGMHMRRKNPVANDVCVCVCVAHVKNPVANICVWRVPCEEARRCCIFGVRWQTLCDHSSVQLLSFQQDSSGVKSSHLATGACHLGHRGSPPCSFSYSKSLDYYLRFRALFQESKEVRVPNNTATWNCVFRTHRDLCCTLSSQSYPQFPQALKRTA